MSKKSLHKLLNGLVAGDIPDLLVSGLQSDSRKVESGDVFLAYPGLKTDGRQYIRDAVNRKAAAVLYDPIAWSNAGITQSEVPLIPLKNLQHQIGEIAMRFYDDPSKSMRVVGVTGTNGKTSCTQFMAQALQRQQIKCGVIGTLGYGFLPELQKSNYTTPDPILLQQAFLEMKQRGAKAVAMEVSSHALDQKRVQGVHFNIAVFTQLTQDHLDYHGDMQTYARAKKRLFEQPGLQYGVVNADDSLGRQILRERSNVLNMVVYSAQQERLLQYERMIWAKKITSLPKGFHVEVQTPWGDGEFETPFLGRFSVSNLLAVLSVLCLFEIPFSTALQDLSQLQIVKGRMDCHGGDNKPLVVIDYAHTPDALEKALMALREHVLGRLFVVFGCGGDRDRGKRPLMATIAESYADRVVFTNDNPRSEPPMQIIKDMMAGLKKPSSVKIELNREIAIQWAVQNALIGDIVLVAGKGHETTQIVGDTTLPFDDSQVVSNTLNDWIKD